MEWEKKLKREWEKKEGMRGMRAGMKEKHKKKNEKREIEERSI